MVAATAAQSAARAQEKHMATRKIPASGEMLPVVGMGSSNTFDVGGGAEEREALREVLRLLIAGGGTVIDTSPMYGRSESVLGDLINELGARSKLWIAT
jgi:aryl-alcohol dehydrogenase-like predicted oxidoreductase